MRGFEFIHGIAWFFPWGAVKLAILILISFYIIFAAIIVRQQHLMSRMVEIPHSPTLRLVAIGHLLAAVVIFFLALVLI